MRLACFSREVWQNDWRLKQKLRLKHSVGCSRHDLMMLMFADHADLSFYHIYNIWSYVIYMISFASFFCFLSFAPFSLVELLLHNNLWSQDGHGPGELQRSRQHPTALRRGHLQAQCPCNTAETMAEIVCRVSCEKITIDMSNLDAPKWHCSFHCRTLPFNDEFKFRAILSRKIWRLHF